MLQFKSVLAEKERLKEDLRVRSEQMDEASE